MDYLDRIIEFKKQELAEVKRYCSLEELKHKAADKEHLNRSLKASLLEKRPAIIAEIKRRSPSKGVLRNVGDPGETARNYEAHGAAGISILTDSHFFGGSLNDLISVRNNTTIPVLRKDFIIDLYQVYESLYAGADALLLISSSLSEMQFSELYDAAYSFGMEVLVETETEEDIEKVSRFDIHIIGVNNRNLHTFEENFSKSASFYPLLPENSVKVSESGISTATQISVLYKTGFRGFLIGETLMKAQDPGTKLNELIREFKNNE
ncbi:indole-3-glycerol phosphate synthase TrpC [candidate division KSB1 bacterium]